MVDDDDDTKDNGEDEREDEREDENVFESGGECRRFYREIDKANTNDILTSAAENNAGHHLDSSAHFNSSFRSEAGTIESEVSSRSEQREGASPLLPSNISVQTLPSVLSAHSLSSVSEDDDMSLSDHYFSGDEDNDIEEKAFQVCRKYTFNIFLLKIEFFNDS